MQWHFCPLANQLTAFQPSLLHYIQHGTTLLSPNFRKLMRNFFQNDYFQHETTFGETSVRGNVPSTWENNGLT